MSPVELLGAMMLVMVLGTAIGGHDHETESESDVWYCFICAGTTSETRVKKPKGEEDGDQ